MKVKFQILNTNDPREIILRDLTVEPNLEHSIKIPSKNICSFCYSPLKDNSECVHHSGLIKFQKVTKIIIGGYYTTNFKGDSLSWWTKRIKKIRDFPFKTTSLDVELVIAKRIENFGELLETQVSTAVPTRNLQSLKIFQNLSKKSNIKFIDPNKMIDILPTYKNGKTRNEYVSQKYKLSQNCDYYIEKVSKKSKGIVIFDDILNEGYTLGWIVNLLKDSFSYFYLIVLGRTPWKRFIETYQIPRKCL
ncbi:MAG: hypothetical protein ACFFDF_09885 [Candidatus Odinarchaeota archaeon]